ncbi:DUF4097 family beta strand repeat-containing protein [Kitasatospora acidiphila]|uniref:DUF4097 family beta strand repeat-containing protein n=1 Tax=Kitasatospora acidiphila TaxID=2567942 RepID=UPI003C789E75
MSTVRSFLAGTSQHLDLNLPFGAATVSVDPGATAVSVLLSTDDGHGPAADAIRHTRYWEDDEALNIAVPEIEGGITVVSNGGRTVHQHFGTVTGTVVGMTIVNGRVINGGTGGGTAVVSPITATITLPPTAGIIVRSTSADLTATGHVGALGFTTTSGDLVANSVGALVVATVSGDVRVERIGFQLNAETTSGDVRVGVHEGSDAAITTVSGDVLLTAGTRSTGALAVRTVSGDIDLNGTGHLAVQASTVSGRKHVR